MINYSIVMRTVNQNFIAINTAKGRIKAAKEKGETPDPADEELVKTEVQKAFAVAQYADVMNIEKFARHIATHGCVYSRADIAAILYMAVDCMREMLLEGKKIRLGDMGDFSVSLVSTGAENAEKFSAQNISGVNVTWDPGSEFKNLLSDAEFNLVASRKAQQAVVSAIKAGKTLVDISGNTAENEEDEQQPGQTQTPDQNQTGGSGTGSQTQTPDDGGTTVFG